MFMKPLRITACKDVFWSVTASDLPVRGSGATPREAMDDLAVHLVEAVGRFRRRGGSSDDPLGVLFSEYIDPGRPCPDPDIKVCGESIQFDPTHPDNDEA